jgi:tRNA threonylcarbamoyladenosine biosynthesis protein TsaE
LTPVEVVTSSAAATRELGRRLAALLRPGDVVVLAGELGAGKTTLTQGIGAALGVRGAVTSPTFVIARLHPPAGAGTGLLHVDAYRMGDAAELDDLDLDAFTDDTVTVVEWGDGVADSLSASRLHVHLARDTGAEVADESSGQEPRVITVTPVGERWDRAQLQAALSDTEEPFRRDDAPAPDRAASAHDR